MSKKKDDTPDLFDALADRDEALKKVAEPEEESGWMERALSLLPEVFHGGYGELIAEDIKDRLVPLIGPPHHGNVWGAFTNRAIRARIIQPTGKHRHMHGPKSHARQSPVYCLIKRRPEDWPRGDRGDFGSTARTIAQAIDVDE
jgi:hypothetical protein